MPKFSPFVLLLVTGTTLSACGWETRAPITTAATVPVTSQQVASSGTEADLDRIICRKDEATGSRLRAVEVCKTRREWERLREETSRGMNNVERERGNASKVPMGGG